MNCLKIIALLIGVSSSESFAVSSCGRRIYSQRSALNEHVNVNEETHAECYKCNDVSKRSFLLSAMCTAVMPIIRVPVAVAAYGESSAMAFPSYFDFLVDRNTAPDDSSALYKGSFLLYQVYFLTSIINRS